MQCPEEMPKETGTGARSVHSGRDSVTASNNSKLPIQVSNLATACSHQLTKRDANPLSTISLLQPANLSHQPTIGRHLFLLFQRF